MAEQMTDLRDPRKTQIYVSLQFGQGYLVLESQIIWNINYVQGNLV